jgi:hypothetical protein
MSDPAASWSCVVGAALTMVRVSRETLDAMINCGKKVHEYHFARTNSRYYHQIELNNN